MPAWPSSWRPTKFLPGRPTPWTWRARQGDLRFAAEGLKRSTAAPDGAIEALEGIETVDPDEFFRQMGESEDVNQQ